MRGHPVSQIPDDAEFTADLCALSKKIGMWLSIVLAPVLPSVTHCPDYISW